MVRGRGKFRRGGGRHFTRDLDPRSAQAEAERNKKSAGRWAESDEESGEEEDEEDSEDESGSGEDSEGDSDGLGSAKVTKRGTGDGSDPTASVVLQPARLSEPPSTASARPGPSALKPKANLGNDEDEEEDVAKLRAQRRADKAKKKKKAKPSTGVKFAGDGDEEESEEDADEALARDPSVSMQSNAGLTKSMKLSSIGTAQPGAALSRKEREAQEKKAAKERYWAMHQAGKTDEAKADLARLNRVRAEREEAKLRREAEAEAKQQAVKEKLEASGRGGKRRRAAPQEVMLVSCIVIAVFRDRPGFDAPSSKHAFGCSLRVHSSAHTREPTTDTSPARMSSAAGCDSVDSSRIYNGSSPYSYVTAAHSATRVSPDTSPAARRVFKTPLSSGFILSQRIATLARPVHSRPILVHQLPESTDEPDRARFALAMLSPSAWRSHMAKQNYVQPDLTWGLGRYDQTASLCSQSEEEVRSLCSAPSKPREASHATMSGRSLTPGSHSAFYASADGPKPPSTSRWMLCQGEQDLRLMPYTSHSPVSHGRVSTSNSVVLDQFRRDGCHYEQHDWRAMQSVEQWRREEAGSPNTTWTNVTTNLGDTLTNALEGKYKLHFRSATQMSILSGYTLPDPCSSPPALSSSTNELPVARPEPALPLTMSQNCSKSVTRQMLSRGSSSPHATPRLNFSRYRSSNVRGRLDSSPSRGETSTKELPRLLLNFATNERETITSKVANRDQPSFKPGFVLDDPPSSEMSSPTELQQSYQLPFIAPRVVSNTSQTRLPLTSPDQHLRASQPKSTSPCTRPQPLSVPVSRRKLGRAKAALSMPIRPSDKAVASLRDPEPTTTVSSSRDSFSEAVSESVSEAVGPEAGARRRSPVCLQSGSTCRRVKKTKRSAKQHHMLTKAFACQANGCDAAFARWEHLARHEKMHTKERPFGCDFPGCGKFFSRSDNMMQHLRMHYRNMPGKVTPIGTRSKI
ncbi:uncharacterized protein L969DRAFT_42403 [Mixia osmundae IAM 14324]|uniref:C2H2-type domain-containing protein n=1 Tax=Mixia osmundae (strain CBS 9802 / IAM 14324 / JCM 22182 / KY 12970) TaxID=764103 RepID=G7DT97_MIXOS|nr:uncharacterized protein L969DRAFT_42403 [Mixia osmundae IAM 14324]KEI42918.1 hypothetical protein L969DRAFT_42403 [Mixia osmundae IAM 14324]GAA93744.1 hypothetical protein E5Q_00390 [Mixia osmundae IAM 14324]